MSGEPQSMEEVLDGIEEVAEKADEVSLGDILDEFGQRSFGPVLLFLPLIELSPLGGIPGVPTIFAALIALVALQLLIGKEHIWLPAFIQKRAASSDNVLWAHKKAEGAAEAIDHWLERRMEIFVSAPALRVAALLIVCLCAMVPPLEVIPFASSAPMIAIASFGLAIMIRDGLVMLVAAALTSGAIYMALSIWSSGLGSSSG